MIKDNSFCGSEKRYRYLQSKSWSCSMVVWKVGYGRGRVIAETKMAKVLAFHSRLTVMTTWDQCTAKLENKLIATEWFTLVLSCKRRGSYVHCYAYSNQTHKQLFIYIRWNSYLSILDVNCCHWVFLFSSLLTKVKTNKNIYQKFERWMEHRASIRRHHGK